MSCSSCERYFSQNDGSVVKVTEKDGVKYYQYSNDPDGVISTTPPAGMNTTTEVGAEQFDKRVEPRDYEKVVMCEVDTNGDPTGVQVLVLTYVDNVTLLPQVTRYNLATLAVWAGDPATQLSTCGSDLQLESDAVEMCDGTTTFLRWMVKEKGEPTGAFFDTDLSGAAYVPVGAPITGSCDSNVRFDYENICLLDDSSPLNTKVQATKRISRLSNGTTTVDYINDVGVVYDMAVFKVVSCNC